MRRVSVVLIALATFATSCAVGNETVDMSLAAATSVPQVLPTPTLDLEVNDEGQTLLPRTILAEFEPSECDFVPTEDYPDPIECGWLTRPSNTDDGESIELPVVVFKATGTDPAPDPIIYLHGGPAGGVLTSLESYYEDTIAPYREHRDVIMFDQRGTGLAEPELLCGSPYQWFASPGEEPATFVARTARACAYGLEINDVELSQFSRQRSADDVMALARELGYEQFNLHGSSWGGLLAYTVMQLHPDLVRSSVLDSPLSVWTDLAGSMPASFQEAMAAMQANCDFNPACAARHGNIVARYVSVFDTLQAEPAEILIQGVWPVEMNGFELSYLLFAMFYVPELIAVIPDLLLDLENGDTRLVEEMATVLGWGWGMNFTFLTYMCTDVVPQSSDEAVEEQRVGIEAFDVVDEAPDGRGASGQEICERMMIDRPPINTPRQVTPTQPTLVFTGAMDPITSRSSSVHLAESLPNGRVVAFDDLSHGVTADPCATTIATAFFDDPEQEIDLSCSLAENRPRFEFEIVSYTVPG